eukprot:SAG11_NODE_9089_length_944_cov_2.469822_1_plen_41_part_10
MEPETPDPWVLNSWMSIRDQRRRYGTHDVIMHKTHEAHESR